jgi:hypothetical protein
MKRSDRWVAAIGLAVVVASGIISLVFRNQLNWFIYNLLISLAALGIAAISILLPGALRTRLNLDIGQAAKLSAFGPLAVFALLLWVWTGQAPAVVGFCDLSGRWRCHDDKGFKCHETLKIGEILQDGAFAVLYNERHQSDPRPENISEGYFNPKTNELKTQKWGNAGVSNACNKIDFEQSTYWTRETTQ